MTVRRILTGENRGFTLIELLVVLAIVALLAGLAAPVLFSSLQKSRESALLQNLYVMRKSLDDYYSDNDRYPASLQELLDGKYLRAIPKDPITENKNSWILVYDDSGESEVNGISDIKSGAQGISLDGESYQDW